MAAVDEVPVPTPPEPPSALLPFREWTAVGMEVCAVVWFAVGFLLLPGLAALAASRLGMPFESAWVILIVQTAGLLALPLLLRAFAPSWRAVAEHFRLGVWRGWWFGKGFLLAAALALLVAGVTVGWTAALRCLRIPLEARPPNQEVFFNGGESGRWLMTAAALLAAPLWEEMAFRNGLYGLLRRLVPSRSAAALTAVVFASLHGSLIQFPGLVLLSLCWQKVRVRTQSFWSSVMLHFYNNLFALLMMWALLPGDGSGAA